MLQVMLKLFNLKFFSRPLKGVRPRRSEEHLPSSKAVSRPTGGGAKKPSAPASRGGGGAGAKVIDSRGRVSRVAGSGGGGRKSTPSGGSKRPAGRDKV